MLSQLHELRRVLGAQGRTVRIDSASFAKRYRACQLVDCQGMCCYDGVFLEACEVTALERVVAEETDRLRAWGVDPSEGLVERQASSSGRARWRTKLVPFRYHSRSSLPAHFNSTRCVFRLGDGRCSLQRLSVERGKDPWYFKPMGCWLHPLRIAVGASVCISVGDSERPVPFASCTGCGREWETGVSGFEVFRRELEVLETLFGRPLV